eukprot:TRINITY_DN15521_c0_g3_i1.p1 TRINITY_DN15521_c0_g3~~TRINITY_DN15521_c0_g3_i1.p1  ORF type:complete len:1004 (+),score=324.80 TRINITY_DN15521_c0_g3_i1:95-3013(+)
MAEVEPQAGSAVPFTARHLYTQQSLFCFAQRCSECRSLIASVRNPAAHCLRCSLCGKVVHAGCAAADGGRCIQLGRAERLSLEWVEQRLPEALRKIAGGAPLLNLGEQRLGDDALMAVADQLTLSQHMATLLLSGNRIGDGGAAALAGVLRHSPSLTALALGGNQIGCDGAASLAKALDDGGGAALTDLNLERNCIGDRGALAICGALGRRGGLASLSLASNELTEAALVPLCALPCLESLRVGGNRFRPGRQFLGDLGRAVLGASRLRELDFEGSSQGYLGAEGAVHFAELLRAPQLQLTALSLARNRIDDDGLLAVAQGLGGCRSLRSLSLEGNTFGDPGARVLAAALRGAPQGLQSLDVRGTALSQGAVEELNALPITLEFGGAEAGAEGEGGGGDVGRPAEVRYGWCSSCFAHEEHRFVHCRAGVRKVYQCRGCAEFSVRCVHPSCGDMANYHQVASSYWCALHAGEVSAWGSPPEPLVRWCSWCYGLSEHALVKMHGWRRSIYRCGACGRRSLRCASCAVAMARGHDAHWDDRWCARCDGTLKHWRPAAPGGAEISDVSRQGWCSWCYEHGAHVAERRSKLLRCAHRCTHCSKPTVRCLRCPEGMACSSFGPSAALCARCEQFAGRVRAPSLAQTWEALSEGKRLVYRGQEQRSLRADLTRSSNYRALAAKAGLLRPFLMLCAMGCDARFHTALSLDICLLRCPCFGDSHAEAWHLLRAARGGVASRAGYCSEALNPFGAGCTWIDVLERVTAAYQPSQASGPSGARILGGGHAERVAASQPAAAGAVDAAESALLAIAAEHALEALGDSRRAALQGVLSAQDPSAVELVRRLKRAGITDNAVYLYTLWLTLQTYKTPGVGQGSGLQDPLQGTNLAAVGLLVRDAVMHSDGGTRRDLLCGGDVLLPAALLATPLAPLGCGLLVCSGMRGLFAPDTPALFCCLVNMLNIRLLLAVEGVDLREFCTAKS